MTDHNMLAKQAIKGDYDAFDQLVEQHKDKVYSTCLQLLGSVPEALEAAEQVFVATYRSLPEVEGKSVADLISRVTDDHATTLRRELDRHGYSQANIEAGILKTVDGVKAPPGFTQAIRERLRLDAELVKKDASRRKSRKLALGVAAASASLLTAWAGWQYFPGTQAQVSENTPQASSLPSPAIEPAPPTAAPSQVSPEAPPLSPAPQVSKNYPLVGYEHKLGAIPEIVIGKPRHENSAPENIFRSVSPPLKSQPVRDGNTWTVDLTDDQFWSMHTLLTTAYSKVRIPESALPRGGSQIKLRVKFSQAESAQKKLEPARKTGNEEIETRSRLPVEDLLKDEQVQ